ncbi:type II secretion system F family protein [Kitasatospora sp. MAP5-34]|uniref:type II secretion system F family protein n=1 Tax=Kitasatospora sp. MAP5-34 TaxID=3035102 RepID=UPI0024730772|nr:type II secretion system F family protein [Kitasatospora sp. MAP5-34]MDH6578982.1 Flp pilus assembly protein TadB [Kitasatospora sp. MAP5-34]
MTRLLLLLLLFLLPVVLTGLASGLRRVRRRRTARRRIERGRPTGDLVRSRAWRPGFGSGRVGRWARSEWLVPVLAGLGTVAVIGGPAGVVTGVLLGTAARRWLPRARSPDTCRAALEHERLTRQLPLTAELLAACLGSSSSPAAAAAAVAGSVGSPMSGRLAAVAAELSLGAPPERCWERLGADSPALAPLARCLVRTSVSGAPPTAPLTGLAHAHRAAASRAAHARVRRAGVLATAPLGVCFLPAFILIGVVPVVMGLTALFARRV